MDGRDAPAVQFGDVPQVGHAREVSPCNGHRGLFNLAGPQRDNALPLGRKGKHANAIKQAPQSQYAAHAQCAPKTLLAMLPVLNSMKVSSTV